MEVKVVSWFKLAYAFHVSLSCRDLILFIPFYENVSFDPLYGNLFILEYGEPETPDSIIRYAQRNIFMNRDQTVCVNYVIRRVQGTKC